MKKKKKNENILNYDISYKTFMGSIPLRIRFDEIDGFIKIYNRVRYLVSLVVVFIMEVLLGLNIFKVKKRVITDGFSHNFARIRIDSYDYLPIEKVLNFHNVIILIKSVINENKNHY